MIEIIEYRGEQYPKFQSEGFAAQFAFPFAKQVCKGRGYDIGCNRLSWKLPEAMPIDPIINPIFNAMYLPDEVEELLPEKKLVDYIFSSHCLEHLEDWVAALDYWTTKIKSGGTLFLYLPHPDQLYWRPYANRKHIHCLHPVIIRDYLVASGSYKNIFVSERDLNHSFIAMAERI